ncbi:MAG: FMN-dependent NADH-azoreductase [Gammaproteobacteria bacterium HGW-Gammaproteobacteria-14]|nr:MAG: FMN-dependent NADH-azoreductase [Gammaproteobacteria bacterium HGW-Gammaproteobacteria-14]
MATLLSISSSIFGDQGNTSQLAGEFVARWQAQNPQGSVVHRDVGSNPLPHLDSSRVGAFFTPAEQRSAEQQAVVAQSDALIAELNNADAIVIGLPMYNFGVPSQFKAWIDHVARAGVTFKYTDTGPVGLLADKPVIVFAARGGLYANTPNDHQEPFMRQFLGFIGLNDVRFVYAEGVNMGDEPKAKALAGARNAMDAVLAAVQAA